MRAIKPPFVTAPLDHPALPELMKQLGCSGGALPVRRHAEQLPVGNCYWNAARFVADKGGRIRFGWTLHLWPDRYISAQHHGVWEDPDGVMWDVTADIAPGAADHTTFVLDEKANVSLYRTPNIRNRHLSLSRHKRVAAVIDAYHAKHAAEDVVARLAYEAGYRCEDQFRIAAGQAPVGSIDCSDKQANMILAANRKVAEATMRLGDAITRLVEWRG